MKKKTQTNSIKTKNTPKVLKQSLGEKLYSWLGITVLLITTGFWSLWGARVQQLNADQLVNPHLFDSWHTFNNALFPVQHSFLFKWPLFIFVRLLGATSASYITITVITSVLTVALFALLLYRINSRPIIFSTLCLFLAGVLLLVPAAPYAGAILPTNFAMLTTRNLEYVFYIGGLLILLRYKRLKSWYYALGVVSMSVLFASDKLFLTLSLGGSAIGIVGYSLFRQWSMVKLCLRWLGYSLLASLGSYIILSVIKVSGLTNIVGGGVGPYGMVHSAHTLATGTVFGILGTLTNFGANPAFDALVFRDIPHLASQRYISLGGLGYVANLSIFLLGLWSALALVIHSLRRQTKPQEKPDVAVQLSLLLILVSIVAFGSFIASDHYYPVDARYLTIIVFALFISLATYLRKITIQSRILYGTGAVFMLIICGSVIHAKQTSSTQREALHNIDYRTHSIIEILRGRKVDYLVGDYWRVLPVKAQSNDHIAVAPRANCFEAYPILSSKDWQRDLNTSSFAYLLTLDKSLTNYSHCSLDDIINAYGRPNKSSVVAGTTENPEELLLFYDNGIHPTPASYANPTPSTVTPVALDSLSDQTCTQATLMQVIAHEDDDLLFMSPDLQTTIDAGKCVRTIYVTAGDAGGNSYYWLGREKGAEDAYDKMLSPKPARWIERIIKLPSGQMVTIASPLGNKKISLVFMRLSDGNIRGEGFSHDKFESLEKLKDGRIPSVTPADGQSPVSKDALIASLVDLFYAYRPSDIHTQSTMIGSSSHPDHSDHRTVGWLTKTAYDKAGLGVPLRFYAGYPVMDMPKNVPEAEAKTKERIFAAYTADDPAACGPRQHCWQGSNYHEFIPRQYIVDK